jgi:YD repeat-containing protein
MTSKTTSVELTRDIMGRVLKEKSPSGKEVQYQWGGAGCSTCGDGSKLSKITDAAGLPRGDSITNCLVKPRQSDANAWEFKYDVMGNPLEMTYPDNSKITQEYDIAGRLSKFFNKRGQEIDYTYDADGKLTQKTTPEGDIVPKGDSITRCLAKPRHSDANFTYDERERVSEIVGAGFHYRYQYGHVGGVPRGDSITRYLAKPRYSDANVMAAGRTAVRLPAADGDQ